MIEILAKPDHVWELLTVPKEVEFWAPNVRDLEHNPPDRFDVDTVRRYRLDLGGKIETLETRITHCSEGEMFAETPVGGSMKLHEKVSKMKMVFRISEVEDSVCSVHFLLDYEMKGFLGKMFEKIAIGSFASQYRLWFDRLKTYAETGRPV
jgi:hypothetical protein